LSADADGATHRREIELSPIQGTGEEGVDQVEMLSVPATGLGIAPLSSDRPTTGSTSPRGGERR